MNASISDVSVAARRGGSAASGVGGLRLGSRSREVPVLLGLAVALGVVVPLGVAFRTGSIHIPHNDSWTFSRAAQAFAQTGHIHLFGWDAMALVGQVVAAGPFGRSVAAEQCAVAVAAVVGILACFDLLRTSIGSRRAAFAALVIALWPGFGLLATSFMTDIPTFAAIAVTLALGRRALERESGALGWLIASCLVGLWAATIREQAIAAPAAVLAAALLQSRTRRGLGLTRLIVICVVMLAAIGAFELWRRGLPGGAPPAFATTAPRAGKAVAEVFEGWSTLALAVSPAVFVVARPRSWGRAAQLTSVVMLCACVATTLYDQPFLGNYIGRDGAYSAAYLGVRPNVLPTAVWDLMIAVACVSGALLAGFVVERGRRLRLDLACFAVFTVLGTLLEIKQGPVFDRYLLPLAIPALVVVLGTSREAGRADGGASRSVSRVGGVAGAVAGVLLAAVTLVLTVNGLVFDSAVWKAATGITVSNRVGPGSVDAGLDWVGYHSPTAMAMTPNGLSEPGIYGMDAFFPNDFPCYVVADSPQAVSGWKLLSERAYRPYGVFGTGHLYVYRTGVGTCG